MASELTVMTSGMHVAPQNETSVAAAAAQAEATVKARFAMAAHRPRDIDDFRVRLLKACQRTRFAETAIYRKPIGGKTLEGASIRFVEEALRCFGNLDAPVQTIYDDLDKRVVRVSVTDLETNITFAQEITAEKTVERSSGKNREIVAERINTRGDRVFVVRATEDEFATKMAALVSKALRTQGLRVLPGDVVEEAIDGVYQTMRAGVAQDPAAYRKRLVDSFVGVGVKPSDLKLYLGHDLDSSSPAELQELRAIWQTIKDGETTWAEALRAKDEERGHAEPASREGSTVDPKDVTAVKAAAAKRAQAIGDESISATDVYEGALTQLGIVDVAAVAKSDLPKILKVLATWSPPVGDGSASEPAQGSLA